MINGKTVLAMIPARSGSKGLPEKNIKTLIDKPLLAYPIECAKASKYIDRVIVSTDSQDFANRAKNFGAEVPFIRPKNLAEDITSTIVVIEHAISWLKKNENQSYDYFVLLEPTSPLTESYDIDRALEELIQKSDIADSIVGVCRVESRHPRFLYSIDSHHLLKPYWIDVEKKVVRRQDLEELYFLEGSLYISKSEVLLDQRGFYHDKTLPYIVPKWKAFEIDDEVDFLCVEAILKRKLKKDFHHD